MRMDERSATMYSATARSNIIYKLECSFFLLRLCALEHSNGICICKYAENKISGSYNPRLLYFPDLYKTR